MVFSKEFRFIDEDCEITFVSDSLAVLLWLHAAKRDYVPKVHKHFLVAPPWLEKTDLAIQSFLRPLIDHHSLFTSAYEIKLVYSMADPVCPGTARTIFEKPPGLNGICLPEDADHINIESGYSPWPELLEWCISKE